MDQRHLRKKITGVMAILWMAAIFAFSAQPAQQSSQTSGAVAYKISEWQNTLFHQGRDVDELLALAGSMQLFIRKSAHMGEYALLSFLLCLYLSININSSYNIIPLKMPSKPLRGDKPAPNQCRHLGKKSMALLALGITAGYAATDEFHQLFVPGRAGRLSDVCIDSLGGVLGIIFYFLLHTYLLPLWQRFRGKARQRAKRKR